MSSPPSPPASTTSESSSQRNSPKPKLELDPSDPLNLLLHSQSSDTSMDDSSAGASPPDWSQISALWSTPFDGGSLTGEENGKDFTDIMDYSMSLGSDLDFGSQMAIDPHALHFDSQKFGLDDFSLSPGPNFSFAFQPDLNQSQVRRLSIASSSSASGASLSPIADASPTPLPFTAVDPAPTASLSFDAAAEELAQRVRQAAGITLAVPLDSTHLSQNNALLSDFAMFINQNADPGAYLQPASPRSVRSSASSTSSAESTPPPTTPPPSGLTNPNVAFNNDVNTYITAGMGIVSRPKTSHTTIERRYRTNLNARIMSLRMAVPALRVLEDKEGCGVGGGGKKSKGRNATLGKNVAFGSKVKKDGEDGEELTDMIDERGFVDGVKVARKCSKANVLGKAVEYIRVLKKRELRLKREQDGLKSLLKGLVGGPALLSEWEREWREKFGGEEKDEIEGEEIDDGGSDDEGSGDDDDGDDESTRKRKKPKLAPAKKDVKERRPPPPSHPVVLPDGSVVVPEKRKRGRPRKVVPPVTAAVTSEPAVSMHQPAQAQIPQHHPAQYLLATFALFSFFNSPFSSTPSHSPPHHSHTGTVLTHDLPTSVHSVGWSWHDLIQAFHLLVSVLVFSSILAPWFPSIFKSLSSRYISLRQVSLRSRPALSCPTSVALISALSSSNRGSDNEANILRQALDGHRSISATAKAVLGICKDNKGFEQAGLEQRAWMRLGELSVLEGKTSFLERALTCWHIRSHLPWFTASAADLSTLALALWPLGHFVHPRARSTWDAACARKGFSGVREGGVGVQLRPHERLVLENISLDEAVARLKSPAALHFKASDWKHYSPIGVLACMLVRERVKYHLEMMFVRTMLPNEQSYELEDSSAPAIANKTEDNEEEERRRTIEAARSLGGQMAELGDILQKMWTMGVWELDDITVSNEDIDDEEELDLDVQIRILLNTLILYRQIFSSSILGSTENGHGSGVSILLSPPPSPSRKDGKLHYALRRSLGCSVFEADGSSVLGGAIEDARDRLIDMLVECERAGRSL
ncbi:hypothetical protein D9757_003860 [Collybiopsis confluens]|uniref:BHLH domain-containing protein n=1 Tax=Collybiopsis confluens TaxID=2823264 RepID=A0A8H5MDK4_9AGAR|nr:hypothetical protein D9757_003860 [Collybiopsis confluens]